MAIAFSKYIDINSVVAGTEEVQNRDLVPRVFSINPLLPTQSSLQFTNDNDGAANVGDYFGTESEEYKRAVFVFGWLNKTARRVPKMSFSRWADAATAPLIYGAVGTYALAQFTGIAAGAFSLTLGAVTHVVNVDFSGDASLAAVAATLQAAIRTAGAASGAQWTAATCAYDATRGSFQFVGGATGAAVISATDGAETPLAALGWTTGAIFSDGVAVETITTTLNNSVTGSDNFGSFCFTYEAALTLDEVTEAATWNAAEGVTYKYDIAVAAADAATWEAALISIAGCDLTLMSTVDGEYHEMQPMAVEGAIDFTQRNASQNFMFQQFPTLTPSVTDTTLSNTYDGERVNYLGQTQRAGNDISFYQRGVMMGTAAAPVDMGVYVNEQWLRDDISVGYMNLLLAVTRLPTNPQGRGQALGVLQTTVNRGVFNGVISVGKILTPSQINAITTWSGNNPNAWRQVQTSGYWYDGSFQSFETDDNRTEWKWVYVLIYSKDDVVRKVEGTNVLI